jgi:hypothetical protein
VFPGALRQLKGSKEYQIIFHLFNLFQVIFQPFGFGFEMFFFTRPKTGSSLHVISLAVGHPHPLLADSWGADYGHWREGKAWITPRKFLSGQFEEHLTSNHWAYIFLYVLCVYIYSVCIYICSISIYIYIYVNIYINQYYLSIGLWVFKSILVVQIWETKNT